jgi:acetoin utilization protein AcuC
LRAVGAEPGLAPEPADDEQLALCHDRRYIATVRRFSADPNGPPAAGIGRWGDNPAFPGMHEASASVAGGSMAAMAAILRGDVEHAFHPGGGLHHAMRDRASGFCIYDDPALAIALARSSGLRVLYVDLDVHHGDGVHALHADDPGVQTISFHETGRSLFPGTGFLEEVGQGVAAGSIVNVPLEPATGEGPWLEAVRLIVPGVAAAFGPDVIVSQHGCDTHAWDPLAHLRVTTTAMGAAARLVDAVAHRFAGGRWLSTGGGGYDVYRVVPRTWSLVWLAGAHRDPPVSTPAAWRSRWAADAERFGTPGMPERLEDEPNAGLAPERLQLVADGASRAVIQQAVQMAVPPLPRAAIAAGWDPLASAARGGRAAGGAGVDLEPSIVELTDSSVAGLTLAERVIAPAEPSSALACVRAVLGAGAVAVGAVVGDVIVGLCVVGPAANGQDSDTDLELLVHGVAPDQRGRGLGSAILRRLLDLEPVRSSSIRAVVGPSVRDVVDPWPMTTRHAVARSMLDAVGFRPTGGPHLPQTLVFERRAAET